MIPVNRAAKNISCILNDIEKIIKPDLLFWNKGDLVIIDNYKALHSRGHSKTNDKNRVLIRGLIE